MSGDASDNVVCFAEGTLIMTPAGEVPVERLRAGDMVVTPGASAPFAPLLWVGSLHIDLARQCEPTRVAPVMIKAGALAEGVPFRNLHVSPDHGLLIDGVLVPARLLLNGITVVQQNWLREVTYHHLELARHEVVVSEGALTESYLDDRNRHLFGNPAIVVLGLELATGRAAGRQPDTCAPVVAEGDAALAAIRRRIGARAGYLQVRRNRA
ncbi:Hint domain-containing protein [Roseomonas sp. CAU 1739]|uniref:Hint domain-containing protein n=1 Tax=Roseomonas sp. CAU 1739 TaxID=3140364 RepID=UPI00325B1DDA